MTDQFDPTKQGRQPFAAMAEEEEREERAETERKHGTGPGTDQDPKGAASMAGAMATGGGMAGGILVDALETPHDDPVEGRRDQPESNRETDREQSERGREADADEQTFGH